MDSETSPVATSRTPAAQRGAPATARAAVPAVVAVVVTHDPGEWFEETLASLAEQTYPDFSVLVIDTASEVDPTDRVLDVLPDAVVHRLDHNPGYAAATNVALDAVEGASFFLLCHDDVALDEDVVRSMVEEAFRSNAGIVGPKLVDWHEPRRLLQVGAGVDKFGVLAPIAEPGELDQEQHDAVRDVFVVPTAALLVRADLFETLGGFDETIDHLGEDVDLCWRAQVVGARVIVAPIARVRHLEALGLRHPEDDRRRAFARHRLRTTLVAYQRFNRWRVLPQAAVLSVIEAVVAFASGRPGHAGDVLSAWTWNLRHVGDLRRRRRALNSNRRVKDREIRAMQVHGSARVNAFLRGQFRQREDRVGVFSRSSRDIFGSLRDGARQFTGVLAIALTLVVLVSTRGLVFDGIPAIGELARFPSSPGRFFDLFWSGWRSGGLGSGGPQPTAYALLGAASYLFFGMTAVLRAVLIVGLLPLGAIGAWRLARPIGSARASVAAFAVYLAIPVPYNALAGGSWSGLLAFAAAPWLLLLMGRASGIAPYGPALAVDGERAASLPVRRPLGLVLSTGLLLGVLIAFVPATIVVVPVMALALALGSLFCFRVAGVLRLLTITAVGLAVGLLLNAPWSVELLGTGRWAPIVGVGAGRSTLDLGELLRFESGPWGAPPLGFAFLLAGALPIIIGRSWRLEWAVRAWFVVLAGWAVLWASSEGHLGLAMPTPEIILAPAAAALSLTAALGLAAFETDLRRYRFGWRQIVSVVAALGVVAGAIPLGAGIVEGRWRTPNSDYLSSVESLLATDASAPGSGRILWLGAADVLPVGGWRYDDQTSFAATDLAEPDVTDRFVAARSGASSLLADAVRIAETRRTNRLGRLLAPMGVRYLIVVEQQGPSDRSRQRPAPAELTDSLAQQLDLAQIPLGDGLTVYRNTAWISTRSVLPASDAPRDDFTQAVGERLGDAAPALPTDVGVTDASGPIPSAGEVLIAQTADENWHLTVDGAAAPRHELYGWANGFTVDPGGAGRLTYDTPRVRQILGAGQLVLWALVILVRRRARTNERRAALQARQGAST